MLKHKSRYLIREFNLIFRKYILLWSFLGMVIGYLAGKYNPQRLLKLKFLITPLLFTMIFIMIFPTRFNRIFGFKDYIFHLIISSLIIFIASPFLAFATSYIMPERFSFLRSGIIISSIVPPDGMLAAWSGFLEGDILFSLIIQSFTFFISIFFIPFGLSVLFGNNMYFSTPILIKNLFFLIVIPFFIAGLLKLLFKKEFSAEVLKEIKPVLSTISGIIEIIIISISVGLRSDIISSNPVIILWGFFTAFVYYVISFIFSILITRIFRFDYGTSIPLIYENGSKNLSIAMVIAITSFKSQAILGVIACVLAQFPVSGIFFTIIARRNLNIEKRNNIISE